MAKEFHGREASTSPGEPREAASEAFCPDSGRCPRRTSAACVREPVGARLQVVQRSLSGGFLIEDAALLDADARSMFDDLSWEKVPPEKSPTAQGGSKQSKTSTQKPAISCGRSPRHRSFAKAGAGRGFRGKFGPQIGIQLCCLLHVVLRSSYHL